MFDQDTAARLIPFAGKMFDIKFNIGPATIYPLIQPLIYIAFFAIGTASFFIFKAAVKEKSKGYEKVKLTIMYIRENYNSKITLEQIARFVLCDKYTLCKEFKKFTGQTVFENLNNYRCLKAAQYLSEGITVTQAASLCGFENFSFFSKTFKKHIGTLPSKYKNARV